MEAGTPGKYYINPSPKLMSKASEWRVVEHEDSVEMIFNKGAFGDNPIAGRFYYDQATGDSENKDDYYSFFVNSDFLNFKEVTCEFKDDFMIFYIPKIKVEDNKKKNKNQNNKKNKKKN
ncbi:hypothetical protein MKW98_016949 [Papaver atlanticum]|uniref:Uncharacterized protein n=1 Tax=Papaver atlanticum TaxID=357466 RepID=A0AAD4TKE9_9MAGN|nr:hypothetical protein MKW98_016949 [Papaver atlanticum]